jgi:UDP-glucuronate decarboxylase
MSIDSSEQVIASDLDAITATAAAEFDAMSGTRVLITGGGGFLGHYLVRAAMHWNSKTSAPPIRVTVFDNWVRGVPGWLDALENDRNLTVETMDMTKPLPSDMAHFDWIIHAASIASPIYYRKYPIETMDANVNGLRNLLDYAREEVRSGRGVRGFLFYSTSEIYGDPTPENIPTPETYRGNVSCTGPRACYDESKRYGETLCVNFAQAFGLPIRVARPFNNYGPGLKITDRRVIPDFARDIVANRDIVMLSSGSPTRTFCYISDAIAGYYKALVRGRSGEAYNIGTEAPEISMAELADSMARIASESLGYRGKVVIKSSDDPAYLVDNPNRRCPSIEKARRELGFSPAVRLEDGLRRSLLWYRENSSAEEA